VEGSAYAKEDLMNRSLKLLALSAATVAAFACSRPSQAADETTDSKPADAKSAGSQIDPALPSYQKVEENLSGTLNAIGSDTMNNIVTGWGEALSRLYPSVKVQVEGKGSGSAPPALIEGTAQLGPMSRDMKPDEINSFESKFGYKPTRIKACLDALAVFVHKDNPIQSLTMQQVDSIFSSTRKAGGDDITTWGQLGLGGEWADKPITIYGRNSTSGTYTYFKEKALLKGDFRDSVKETSGSAGVVQGISEDRYAIGYSGIGYLTSGVKTVGLTLKEGGTVYKPTLGNVKAETYPLGRYLNLYVNKAPSKPFTPEVREFLRFVFTKEGQEVVAKEGFLPLSEKDAATERAKVQ
jgi:phosphate transport system substrate-binding protein